MNAPIRIVIVDDHASLRDGLRNAIAALSDLEVVGEAATWQLARKEVETLRPDVLVLDLNLPDGNGWTLMEHLRAQNALPPTLILSACDEQMFARRLLRAGARGYLMKDEPLARIVEAIRLVYQGTFVASPAITNALMEAGLARPDAASPGTLAAGLGSLSDRELQIFTLLGQGMRNKEIAERLTVGEKTVSTYKARLMEKLGIATTRDLLEFYRATEPGS